MKLSTSAFWQMVAWLAAASNQYLPLIPDRFKPYATAAFAIAGVLLHVHAGNRDQQGNVIVPVANTETK